MLFSPSSSSSNRSPSPSTTVSYSTSDLILVRCPDLHAFPLPATLIYETDTGLFLDINVNPSDPSKKVQREVSMDQCSRVSQSEMSAAIRSLQPTTSSSSSSSRPTKPPPIPGVIPGHSSSSSISNALAANFYAELSGQPTKTTPTHSPVGSPKAALRSLLPSKVPPPVPPPVTNPHTHILQHRMNLQKAKQGEPSEVNDVKAVESLPHVAITPPEPILYNKPNVLPSWTSPSTTPRPTTSPSPSTPNKEAFSPSPYSITVPSTLSLITSTTPQPSPSSASSISSSSSPTPTPTPTPHRHSNSLSSTPSASSHAPITTPLPYLPGNQLCSSAAYQLMEPVGSGSFGVVYRANCLPLGQEVAIKILDVDSNFEKESEMEREAGYKKFIGIWREVTVTRLSLHPNIVRYHHVFVEGSKLWIVMPLMSGGSMKDAIDLVFPNGIKDEALLACILYEVVKALEYLHSNGKIHKDVKAENILLSSMGDVGLADFGVTVDLEEIAADLDDEDIIDTPQSPQQHEEPTSGKASPRDRERSNSLSANVGVPPPAVVRRQRRKQQKSLAYGGSPAFMAPEVIGQPEFLLPTTTGKDDPSNGGEALLGVQLTKKPLFTSPGKRVSRISVNKQSSQNAHVQLSLGNSIKGRPTESISHGSGGNDGGGANEDDDGPISARKESQSERERMESDASDHPYGIDLPSPPVSGSPRSTISGLLPSPWELPSKFAHDAYFDSHHFKSDVWSLGITTLELAFGCPPHARSDPKQMRKLIVNDPPPSTKSYRDESHQFTDAFHSFVSSCLVKEPSKRCSSSALAHHKFFKKFVKKHPQKYIVEKLVTELMKLKAAKYAAEQRERRQQELNQKKKLV